MKRPVSPDGRLPLHVPVPWGSAAMQEAGNAGVSLGAVEQGASLALSACAAVFSWEPGLSIVSEPCWSGRAVPDGLKLVSSLQRAK